MSIMSAKFDHDVIVVGAGPAGSCFARMAAGAGLDVLVVEKRKEVGSPVRCGEGLGRDEIIKQKLEMPEAGQSVEVFGAKLIGPNGKEIVWRSEKPNGWVLERKIFDKWLAELAVEKGAEVHTYTRALEVLKDDKGKPNGLRLSHGGRPAYDVHAPLIVSAEGMESLIARQLGFKTVHALYDVDTCYEYEMKPYQHDNLIELYFGNTVAPRGYVWIFPKRDKKANVGIGIGGNLTNAEKGGDTVQNASRPVGPLAGGRMAGAGCSAVKGADPKILLDAFVGKNEQLRNASTLLDFGGVISVGAPIDSFVNDNCMVVGTAAKQVDPIHGGGIALAMEAGLMAAAVAVKAHTKKDYSKATLSEYEKQWRAGSGKLMEQRLAIRKALEKFSDDDFNHIFNSLDAGDVEHVMNGKLAGPVAKILAGRPQLLGVLSALVPKPL